MIRVQGLGKRYGSTPVLQDVSFTVEDGEAVALWGPNGAGKTTIVRCLLGLARFDGEIEVAGLDVRTEGKAVRRRVGHVPQELAFYEDLTVDETLTFSASIRGVPEVRITEVLELVELADEREKRVGALSGGMRQRLALAVALLSDPPVLVLDEPTSNLDVAGRERIVGLLDDLRSPDRILLLTSHHLEEVGMLVERVVTLDEGRVGVECEPAELAERLGLRSWLHVVVPESQLDQALARLRSGGFDARRNSRGLVVEVSASSKGAALAALQAENIDIVDLEVWR